MTGLALRSLRHRPAGTAATFLAVLFGTVLIGSFATLVESAFANHGDDRDSLVIMGAVVGGWGAAIVLYSVASTVGITATQRSRETGLLRTIGATPRQVRRLIGREVLATSVVAALAGAGGAALAGRVLFDALREGGLLSATAVHAGGIRALASTAGLVVLTSSLAAAVAVARATRGSAVLALREADAEPRRMPRWRAVLGLSLVAYGLAAGVVTVAVTGQSDDPYDAMATSGSSSILVGLGLAVMAPWLLERLARPAIGLLGWFPSGHLASYNATRRAQLLSGVLAPVVVLVAGAVGTLMVVGIDRRTMHDPAQTADGDLITMLNYVVIGMISLFAAVMVVNAFAAVVVHRRAELRRLRLVGATPGQARRTVVVEAGIVAVVGIVLGGLASLTTIVPFAVVRDEGLVPDGQLWLPGAVAIAVTVLTLGSARGAVGRVVRGAALP